MKRFSRRMQNGIGMLAVMVCFGHLAVAGEAPGPQAGVLLKSPWPEVKESLSKTKSAEQIDLPIITLQGVVGMPWGMKPAIEMAVRWRDGITQDLVRIAAQPIIPEAEKELMALIRVRDAFLDRGGYGNFVLAVAITGSIDVALITRLYEDTKDLAAVRRLVVANGVGPKRLLSNLRRVLLLELPEDQVFPLPENFQALNPYEAWEAVMRYYITGARMGKGPRFFSKEANWRIKPEEKSSFLGECFHIRSPFMLYRMWSALVLDIHGDINVLLQVCEKQGKPLKAIERDQLRREISGVLAGGGNPPYRLLTFSPNEPMWVTKTVRQMKERKQDAIRTKYRISGYFRDIEGQYASKLSEPQLGVKLSAAKNVVTAGENFALRVTLKNLSDREATVSPLQPFAFLRIIVESEGKLKPQQVKRRVAPEPDVTLRPAQQIQKELDIGTWFPHGLYTGSCKIHISYQPDRNRRGMIESNVVEVEVKARTAEQENEYQDFVKILRASGDKANEKCHQFLKQHKGSMFEPRVRLELAGRYGAWKQFEKVHEPLGTEFAQASPTKREQITGLYFRTRAFRDSGKFQEALTLAESINEAWAKREAQMIRVELKKAKQEQGEAAATEDMLPDKP